MNNMVEYEALIHELRVAKDIGIKCIVCCGDSDLFAQQVDGTWNAWNPMMAAYRDEVDEIAKYFKGYKVKYVKRENNEAADLLSKLWIRSQTNSARHFSGTCTDTIREGSGHRKS